MGSPGEVTWSAIDLPLKARQSDRASETQRVEWEWIDEQVRQKKGMGNKRGKDREVSRLARPTPPSFQPESPVLQVSHF